MGRSWAVSLAVAALVVVSIPTPLAQPQQTTNNGRLAPPLVDDPRPPPAKDDPRLLTLATAIEQAIAGRTALADSSIGIVAADVLSGRVLYQRNGDQAFNVASNAKLATASAALSILGPEFRFRTSVSAEEVSADGTTVKGDLYVRSLGDPYLGTADLHSLAEQLRLRGIRRVSGGIAIDNSYFDGQDLPPHFDEQPDEHAGFRAPIAASALNFNTVSIMVVPAPSGLGLARVEVDPPSDYVRVNATVQTADRGRTRIRVDSKPTKDTIEFVLTGQIRPEAPPRRIRRRVPHPSEYLAASFRAILEEHGIKVGSGRLRLTELPDGTVVLAANSSPALAEIVRALGKYSNNFVAEILLKTIGAETIASESRPATWQDGLATVRQYLAENVGLKANTFRYDNGSGLFDASSFSPRQMTKLLVASYLDFRIAPDFVAALSVGGADGTLSDRFTDSAATRQVRAKTGTLESVSALSGYVAVDGRTPVAFSVLVNQVPKWQTDDARSVQDAVVTALTAYLHAAN